MKISVSGYSIIKDKVDKTTVKGIKLYGLNLDNKSDYIVGYAPVCPVKYGKMDNGLFIPARYVNYFSKEIVGKNVNVGFNLNGYVESFDLIK